MPEPRAFPVQLGRDERRQHRDCPRSVPWDLVAPHQAQATLSHGKSLDYLAEHGGLSPIELAALLQDKPWEEVFAQPHYPERLRAAIDFLLAKAPQGGKPA